MSNSIITSLFWVRKNWARSIPLEYESLNNIQDNKQIKKISKISKKLKEEGKLTGNETIKESTKIIEENMDIDNDENEENIQMPIFCEDLKNYYTKDEDNNISDNKNNLPEYFDDISDEELDDFTIHPTDSLLVCGTAQDDFSNLEIYLYDENNLNLFVHHDIVLSSFPLSLEWLPLKNNNKCNYALVGSFTPGIEIWNLDLLDVLEPEIILGNYNEKNKNNIDTNLIHTDAVMSLSLNQKNPNLIASSGADSKILIWDLNSPPNTSKVSYNEHKGKVQSVKWNKIEDNLLVSGSFDKTIRIFDIRTGKSVFTYNIHNDIECIDWSSIDNYKMLFSFEDGRIQLFDLKMFSPISNFEGHKKEATSVSFSPQQKSLFCSVGRDGRVKIWDDQNIISDNNGNLIPNLIIEKYIKKSTGELFTCKFADDCDYTIAVGGSKGELFIWQLEESPIFCSKYNLKYEEEVIPEHLKNIPHKKRIAFRKGKKK